MDLQINPKREEKFISIYMFTLPQTNPKNKNQLVNVVHLLSLKNTTKFSSSRLPAHPSVVMKKSNSHPHQNKRRLSMYYFKSQISAPVVLTSLHLNQRSLASPKSILSVTKEAKANNQISPQVAHLLNNNMALQGVEEDHHNSNMDNPSQASEDRAYNNMDHLSHLVNLNRSMVSLNNKVVLSLSMAHQCPSRSNYIQQYF